MGNDLHRGTTLSLKYNLESYKGLILYKILKISKPDTTQPQAKSRKKASPVWCIWSRVGGRGDLVKEFGEAIRATNNTSWQQVLLAFTKDESLQTATYSQPLRLKTCLKCFNSITNQISYTGHSCKITFIHMHQ